MHCDTLQIFTQGQKGEQGARVRGGILGLGLLIGGAILWLLKTSFAPFMRLSFNLDYFRASINL